MYTAGSTSCVTPPRQRRGRMCTGVENSYRCHWFPITHHKNDLGDIRGFHSMCTRECVHPCGFACHAPICRDASGLKREDPAVPWWKAACYRKIWLQELGAFILIKETCACSAQLRWQIWLPYYLRQWRYSTSLSVPKLPEGWNDGGWVVYWRRQRNQCVGSGRGTYRPWA